MLLVLHFRTLFSHRGHLFAQAIRQRNLRNSGISVTQFQGVGELIDSFFLFRSLGDLKQGLPLVLSLWVLRHEPNCHGSQGPTCTPATNTRRSKREIINVPESGVSNSAIHFIIL